MFFEKCCGKEIEKIYVDTFQKLTSIAMRQFLEQVYHFS